MSQIPASAPATSCDEQSEGVIFIPIAARLFSLPLAQCSKPLMDLEADK